VSKELHDQSALTPVKYISVPNGYEFGWASEPVWMYRRIEKFVYLPGFAL
jgi:hypothetical protein